MKNKLILFLSMGYLSLLGFSQEKSDYVWDNLYTGGKHVIGLTSDGYLWSWGYNGYGQLGIGNDLSKGIPVRIGQDNDWVLADAGYMHTLALKADGTIWACGLNAQGQVGVSEPNVVLSPVQIGSDNDWRLIAAGNYTSFAIKNDGSLWSWGANTYTMLGLAISDVGFVQTEPIMIGEDYDWDTIYVGEFYCFAKKTNGSLWGWGYNFTSQLGNNGAGQVSSPVLLENVCQWKNISAGIYHTLAIHNDGSLWAWGANNNGALGTGADDGYVQNTPIQIGDENNWSQIKAGYHHSLAIKNDASLWGWGKNDNGALGIGDNENRYEPVELSDESNYYKIFAGLNYSFTLDSVAAIFCAAGSNDAHQLADCYLYDNSSTFICNSIRDSINIVNSSTIIQTCLNNSELVFVQAENAESYLWQISYDGGILWQNIIDNDLFTGAQNFELNINDLTIDFEDIELRCIITADCLPNDTSENASFIFTIPNVSLEINELFIAAVIANADYQWIDCNSEQFIENETNASFYPQLDGNYAVLITENNCSAQSECVQFTTVGTAIKDEFELNDISIEYLDGQLVVQSKNTVNICLYDNLSRSVFTLPTIQGQVSVDISSLASGLYIVRFVDSSNRTYSRKLLKN